MATRYETGWPERGGKTPLRGVAKRDLVEALMGTYDTDAHLVCFVDRDDDTYYRVRKDALAQYEGVIECQAVLVDVDNPEHHRWQSDDEVRAQHHKLLDLDLLSDAGWYFTNGGYRIVQPVAVAHSPADHERYLARWREELQDEGIKPDAACKDWTRLFRAPRVRRDGVDVRPFVFLDRMSPVELAALPDLPAAPEGARTRARRVVVAPTEWKPFSPKIWHDKIPIIAEAVAAEPADWHDLFLALAGTLLDRDVPASHVPSLITAISIATKADTKTDDRERGAKSTIERAASGGNYTGHTGLKRRWPGVAAAVDCALPTGREAQLVAELTRGDVPETPDVEQASKMLTFNMSMATDGVHVVSAECGLGKTRSALEAAESRAAAPDTPTGRCAPYGSKTAIAVSTHKLARQGVDELTERGIKAKRFRSPLAVLNAAGEPECRFYEQARALVAGGQSMNRLLCANAERPCEYFDVCTAHVGEEGPEDARIAFGPHELMGRLESHAGVTGMLAVDEPPPPMEADAILLSEVNSTIDNLDAFDNRYAQAMTPALVAARSAIVAGPTEESTTLQELVREHGTAVDVTVQRVGLRTARCG